LAHERVQQAAVALVGAELSEQLLTDHVQSVRRCYGQHHAQVKQVQFLEFAQTAAIHGCLLLGLGGLRVVHTTTATYDLLVGLTEGAEFVF